MSDLFDVGVRVVRCWLRGRLCQLPRFQLEQKARSQVLGDETAGLFQGPVLQDAVELQVGRHEELRGALRRLHPYETFRPGLLHLDESPRPLRGFRAWWSG